MQDIPAGNVTKSPFPNVVDDTDLLHRAVSPTTSDEELIAQVQQATFDWGLLSQATGGALKQPKCFVYFLTYLFD